VSIFAIIIAAMKVVKVLMWRHAKFVVKRAEQGL
jgi:hypothetical protein